MTDLRLGCIGGSVAFVIRYVLVMLGGPRQGVDAAADALLWIAVGFVVTVAWKVESK